MTQKQKRIARCILCIVIFLVLNTAFFFLGTYPRHILEGIRDYFSSMTSCTLKTFINFVFWVIIVLFIGVALNCNEFSSVTKKLLQLKKQFFLLLAIQIIFDICSWFIMYTDSLSMYKYVYRTATIAINWLFIYYALVPKRVNSTKQSKYKYMFITVCVLITCVFVVLDFVDISEFQKINTSIYNDSSADITNGNYINGILNSIYISELMSKISEQRNFILDSIIGIVFFVTQANKLQSSRVK